MTMNSSPLLEHGDAHPALPGLAITGLTPGEETAVTAAMLIVMLAADGENVAALVPVETGIDDPCEAGSQGSLIRWAAGHLDDPRQVTPFALEANRSAMHAVDASGTLLHGAAFDLAHETLAEGRTMMIVVDAIGPMDPITPSLTMLDLLARWAAGDHRGTGEQMGRWSCEACSSGHAVARHSCCWRRIDAFRDIRDGA